MVFTVSKWVGLLRFHQFLQTRKGVLSTKLMPVHLPKRTFLMNNAKGRATSLSSSTNRLYETTCQNDDTAESTAIIYSFMGCCKASGVDFRSWIIYFLEHVHDYDTDYTMDIAELLPDRLKSAGIL